MAIFVTFSVVSTTLIHIGKGDEYSMGSSIMMPI